MNPEVLHATALAISFDLKKRFAIRPAYGSAIALGNCEITLTSHIKLNMTNRITGCRIQLHGIGKSYSKLVEVET